MYLRRAFKKLKIKMLSALNRGTGIELRHTDNPSKDRSYTNADISRKFESIESERVSVMRDFLDKKSEVAKQLDDKIYKIKRLDTT